MEHDDFEPMRPPADRHEWEDGGERFCVMLVNQELPYGPTINWIREDLDAPEEQMLDAFAWEILRLRKEYDDDGAAEAARIRRQLLEWLAGRRSGMGAMPGDLMIPESEIRAALDRIAPEGKE